jgi:hypothetical protein
MRIRSFRLPVSEFPQRRRLYYGSTASFDFKNSSACHIHLTDSTLNSSVLVGLRSWSVILIFFELSLLLWHELETVPKGTPHLFKDIQVRSQGETTNELLNIKQLKSSCYNRLDWHFVASFATLLADTGQKQAPYQICRLSFSFPK